MHPKAFCLKFCANSKSTLLLSLGSYDRGGLFKDIVCLLLIRSTEIYFDLSRNFFKTIDFKKLFIFVIRAMFIFNEFELSHYKMLSCFSLHIRL